ncbi:unnamed protein product, partial [Rotaria magnacalcarata]
MCSVGVNTEKLTTEYTDGISSGAPTTPTLCPVEHRRAPTVYSSGAPTTPTLCLIGAPTCTDGVLSGAPTTPTTPTLCP